MGYYAYLTLYVPEGSELLDSSPFPLPEGTLYESKLDPGKRVEGRRTTLTVNHQRDVRKTEVGSFVLVKEDEWKELDFRYRLPRVVQENEDGTHVYQLRLQKQAGVSSTEVEVQVVVPPSSRVIEATPMPQHMTGNRLTFLFQLEQDETIVIRFRPS